ncbi:MAG: hypothetical protein AB1461_08630 [Thermodesulfobacteriota bacterium]
MFNWRCSGTASRRAAFLLLLLVSAGCAVMQPQPPVITFGQPVQVDYTCRVKDGGLAATTSAEAGKAADAARSAIFARPPAYGPVLMTAGEITECTECDRDRRDFRLVLEETIQRQLVGLQAGRETPMAVASDELLMDEQEGTIKIRRSQSRLRVKPFDGKQLQEMLGRLPLAGETVIPEGSSVLPFKVLEIKGPAVLVEFQVDQSQPFPTPFGPASIESIEEQEFRIRINPSIGHLIRSGGLIGRVVAVDDDFITFDYRHPFGYEELFCQVTVSDAQVPAQGAPGALSKAGQ